MTPDSGKLGDFVWDASVRRELKSKPGWLSKALRPFVHKGKQRADGENRLDLVLDLKPGVRVKLARLLCDWESEAGDVMDA